MTEITKLQYEYRSKLQSLHLQGKLTQAMRREYRRAFGVRLKLKKKK